MSEYLDLLNEIDELKMHRDAVKELGEGGAELLRDMTAPEPKDGTNGMLDSAGSWARMKGHWPWEQVSLPCELDWPVMEVEVAAKVEACGYRSIIGAINDYIEAFLK